MDYDGHVNITMRGDVMLWSLHLRRKGVLSPPTHPLFSYSSIDKFYIAKSKNSKQKNDIYISVQCVGKYGGMLTTFSYMRT